MDHFFSTHPSHQAHGHHIIAQCTSDSELEKKRGEESRQIYIYKEKRKSTTELRLHKQAFLNSVIKKYITCEVFFNTDWTVHLDCIVIDLF